MSLIEPAKPQAQEVLETRRHSAAVPWTYADLDQRQRIVAAQVRGGGPGALLLSEVAPVITLGRRAQPDTELTAGIDEVSARGIGIYSCDRGGLATWHGPGQWVLFAVDHLERMTGDRRGVRKAVEGLLEIACETARLWMPDVEIRGDCMTGVWSPRGKIASVGVHIEDGVLLHGLAVNCMKTPVSFFGLRPCGMDAATDYLLSDATDDIEFEQIGRTLAQKAAARFPRAFGKASICAKSSALRRVR